MFFPDVASQSNNGGLFGTTSGEVRGHSKGEGTEEATSDASQPLGLDDAGGSYCVPGVGGSAFAGNATSIASTVTGGWTTTAIASRARVYFIARYRLFFSIAMHSDFLLLDGVTFNIRQSTKVKEGYILV